MAISCVCAWLFSRSCRLPRRGDFGGDQLLQTPQIAVANTALFEMDDRIVQIFRAGAPVPRGSRERSRHLFQIELAGVGTAFGIGDDSQRGNASPPHITLIQRIALVVSGRSPYGGHLMVISRRSSFASCGRRSSSGRR
jgi:hypothetical protein